MRYFIFLRQLARELARKLFPNRYPWMRIKELEVLEHLINTVRPRTVLEWGSGISTTILPKRFPSILQWTAIESDPEWARGVLARIPKNAVVLTIPANRTQETIDGNIYEYMDYVNTPGANGAKYDLIIVDGRARAACLKRAQYLLNPGGVVFVHDANRMIVDPELRIEGFRYRVFDQLTDKRRDSGGVWVGLSDESCPSLSGRVAEMFFRHGTIWDLYPSGW